MTATTKESPPSIWMTIRCDDCGATLAEIRWDHELNRVRDPASWWAWMRRQTAQHKCRRAHAAGHA